MDIEGKLEANESPVSHVVLMIFLILRLLTLNDCSCAKKTLSRITWQYENEKLQHQKKRGAVGGEPPRDRAQDICRRSFIQGPSRIYEMPILSRL
jgi:hypothetical protein